MTETIDLLLESLKRKVAEVQEDRDRWAYIAATIRINALRHGATDAEADSMVRGERDFIAWIADKIEKREAAIRADSQIPVVKPLVWDYSPADAYRKERYEATTTIGWYSVINGPTGWTVWRNGCCLSDSPHGIEKRYRDPNTACAAAQRHYELTVQGMWEMKPSHEVRQQALKQAAEYVSQNKFAWRFSSPWGGKEFAEEICTL